MEQDLGKIGSGYEMVSISESICDVIKQNESEPANTDFKIQPNKADNFFVSYCFCNPSTACSFGTIQPISMGSVVQGSFANSVNQKNENWIWSTSDLFCLIAWQ